jgi:hypothetical protein
MNSYRPDGWLIFEGDNHYRVLGTWSGGYLDGDYWRLNSGIKSVSEESDYIVIHGFSDSIYKCHKKGYGVRGAYNSSIVKQLEDKGFKLLGEEAAFTLLNTEFKNESLS